MSEQKLKCSVCHAYLFEDDDVVYCPDCGAPYHRDCYNSVGHCVCEDKHGTDEAYKKPEDTVSPAKEEKSEAANTVCDICGESYDISERSCPKCGAPNFKAVGGPAFVPYDFLGGVPENTDLGGGVTAAEARRFVFSNTTRYIPKFAAMKEGKKVGWNWFAFLFPFGWFLSRKMYLISAVTGILSVCFMLFMMPFMNQDGMTTAEYIKIASSVAANPAAGGTFYYLFMAGGFLYTALSVVCGMFGDRIYRNHVIETVRRIKKESDDIDLDYRKKGGANIFLFITGFFGAQMLAEILYGFFR